MEEIKSKRFILPSLQMAERRRLETHIDVDVLDVLSLLVPREVRWRVAPHRRARQLRLPRLHQGAL